MSSSKITISLRRRNNFMFNTVRKFDLLLAFIAYQYLKSSLVTSKLERFYLGIMIAINTHLRHVCIRLSHIIYMHMRKRVWPDRYLKVIQLIYCKLIDPSLFLLKLMIALLDRSETVAQRINMTICRMKALNHFRYFSVNFSRYFHFQDLLRGRKTFLNASVYHGYYFNFSHGKSPAEDCELGNSQFNAEQTSRPFKAKS